MNSPGLARLAILIPALNEAQTIGDVVRGASQYGRVLVIDNGSSDGTADQARKAGAEVLRLPRPGYDAALNAGFARANELEAEFALTMDADGQHSANDIPRFVQALEQGNAAVYGIRGGHTRLSERLFKAIAGRRWGVRDPLCGMKAYRMELYRRRGHFDACRSIGTELVLFAARAGLPVAGIPIHINARADQPRFGNAIRANLTLLGSMRRVIFATSPKSGPAKPIASGNSDSTTIH